MSTPLVYRIAGTVLAGWLSLSAPPASAQESNSGWLMRPWQSEDGLPDNSVAGLAQTPDGYLWIGTPSGLARFDGLHFENVSLTNVVALPNRGIITMVRGAKGGLWLGMDRGSLVCLDGKKSREFTKELPKFIPFNLAEDDAGGCFISYRNGSVYHVENDKAVLVAEQQGLPAGNDFCALATDQKGRVWFGRNGRVGVFMNGAFHTLRQIEASFIRLAPSRDGGVWVCAGFNLFKCDVQGQLQDYGKFYPEGSGTVPTVMIEDHEGAVWIGTSFSGLFRRDASGFQAVPTSHQGILSLTEDGEGNIWAGTFGGGLDRIRRRAIALEGAGEGLPFSSIQSICEDRDGGIWAVTQNGVLAHKTNGKWNAIPISSKWPGDATCVVADAQGMLWIGTRTHGLFCYRGGQFVDWGDRQALEGKTFHTLLIDHAGDVWMGQESPTAILRLHAGQIETFAAPPDSRIIRAMAEDAAGSIWAGTSKGVLLRVTNGKLDEVTPRPAQELASIRCLCATPDGALWIGFAGWGVGCMKDGKYAEINSEQGLFDDYISHIIPDGRGWLWFGSNKGIFKVRQDDLQEAAAGRPARVRSVHYGRSEGLPSLQGTFGDAPDVLRSRDGRIWLPMQTALVVADPDRFYENTNPPPTLLTRVLVDDRLVASYNSILPVGAGMANTVANLAQTKGRLRVPPGIRRIEFEFAAFSFNAPENVQFRFRLKGLDDEWTEAGPRRSASYSRLPGGSYVFEVTACNSDGDWNQTASRLSLVVPPFFWQTWWFRLLALAAFTMSVIAIVRYVSFRRLHRQLRVLEAQAALQKERARIAKDIHDDLGANLTQIAFLGELAQQDRAEPEKAAERVGTISTTARQAIKSLDEIVWAVNPRNDTLAHLLDYAGQFAVDFLRVAGIRCRLDFPEEIPARDLSTDLRHNLFLVVKESLHNIFKHAQATEVWLRAVADEHGLKVFIEDNGRGFASTPNDALSDGLRNMRQRMTDIGGDLQVESQPGAGTKIILTLAWPHEK